MGSFNPPQYATPLIGRSEELTELDTFISDPAVRLVTIFGPGGMGKTRLALACLERQSGIASPFTDGFFFIDLAPLSDAVQLPSALADALNFPLQGDLPPGQQLLNYLLDKKMLLLFDNFEHLLEGVDLVVDLLETTPELKILVTSRERLNIRFEQLYPIEGLQFPDWETPQDAERYAAVQLFLQSARRNQPDFAFQGADDLTYLTRICKVVAGMPLALELAASWVDVLPLAKIAAELRKGLDFLETDMRDLPERHRSVRAAIDNSWQYLTEQERAIFARLSVFRGGFTQEAAKAVTGTDLRQLARLMNKSLLQGVREDGRFQVHELLRQYGKEKLAELGLETTACDRHSEYFCSALQKWQAALNSNQTRKAAVEMEADYRNITLAWEYALDQGHLGHLIAAVNGLGDYYDVTGRWMTGIAHFQDTARRLKQQKDEAPTIVEAARLLILLHAWLANFEINARQIWTRFLSVFQDILQPALEILEQPIMSKIDSRAEEAYLRLQLGRVLKQLDGRRAEGKNHLLIGLRLYRELDDEIGVSDTLYELSFYSQLENLPEQANRNLHDSLRSLPSTGEPRRQVRLLIGLGYLATNLKRYDEAADFFERAYETAEVAGYLVGMFDALGRAGYHARLLGQYEMALDYNDQALALAHQINGPVQVAQALAQKSSVFNSLGHFLKASELHQESMAHLAKFGIAGEVGPEPDEIYLHLGDYEKVESLIRNREDVIPFKGNLVWVYLARARYMQTLSLARELLKQFQTRTNARGEVMASMGLAYYRLGRLDESRDTLCRSLHFCLETRSMADLRFLLPILPLVLFETAESQIEDRSIELWTMVNKNPYVANSQLFADLVGKSMDEFMAILPPERVEAAQVRGQELDWWQTAESLLDELAELGWDQEAEAGRESVVVSRAMNDIGKQNRFVEEEIIATGGFGEVYRGWDSVKGQVVIVKRLKADLITQQPDLLARFAQEGELLRRLNHPNIVQMIASQEIDGQQCLVIEYVAGGTLRELMDKEGQLSLSRSLDISLELADALTRAHHLSIIHRDVKPENVLLAEDGTPRLTDFGIARMIQREGTPLTQSGAMIGTVAYMSPEAFQGKALDARTDIWSFGVLLFEMLAGERPFKSDQIASMIADILGGSTPDLLALLPDCPPALARLIQQMLVKERDNRISRMRQVAAELDRIRDQL